MYKKISVLFLILSTILLFGCSNKDQNYGEITYKVATEDFENKDLSATGEILMKRVKSIGFDSNVNINDNEIKLQIFGIADYSQLKSLGELIGRSNTLKFVDYNDNTILTNENIKNVEVVYQKSNNTPVISMEFDEDGAKSLLEATKRLSKENDIDKKTLFISLNNEVISSPIVTRPIEDGNIIISGNFDEETINELCNPLNIGSLKVQLEVIETNMIMQN